MASSQGLCELDKHKQAQDNTGANLGRMKQNSVFHEQLRESYISGPVLHPHIKVTSLPGYALSVITPAFLQP